MLMCEDLSHLEVTCREEPLHYLCVEAVIVHSASRPFPQRCLDDRSFRNGPFPRAYPSAPEVARAVAASTYCSYSHVIRLGIRLVSVRMARKVGHLLLNVHSNLSCSS
jgi:hypothetical protein